MQESQPNLRESSYAVDPMHECMGAPVQESPVVRPGLPREQEEFMLAVVEKTFQVASTPHLSEEDGRQDLESLKNAKNILDQLWESGSYLFPRAVTSVLNAQKDGNGTSEDRVDVADG